MVFPALATVFAAQQGLSLAEQLLAKTKADQDKKNREQANKQELAAIQKTLGKLNGGMPASSFGGFGTNA